MNQRLTFTRTIQDMRELLENGGFTVGDRNPKLNTEFPGKFMVADAMSDWDGEPTKDAANGPWCIVGDDLDDLIKEAYEENF